MSGRGSWVGRTPDLHSSGVLPSLPSFGVCVLCGVCMCLCGCSHIFVRMLLHIFAQIQVYVCVHLYGDQRTISSDFLNLSPRYFWDRMSLSLELIHQLGWLANGLQRSFCFFPNTAGVACHKTLHLAFCEGSGDLNSSLSGPKETLLPQILVPVPLY